MHEDEVEEDIVDIWFGIGGTSDGRDPVGAGDAVVDEFAELFHGRFDVRLEEASIDLAEGIADGLAFVREFDREAGFELGD